MEKVATPKNIVFEITDRCNQVCRFCSGIHRRSKISEANASDFDSAPWLKHAQTIMIVGCGEALAHPEYPEILEKIHNQTNAKVTLYTNGLALNGKNLEYTLKYVDEIKISVNSIDKKIYNTIIAAGNYSQSMENLRQLSLRKPKRQKVTVMLVGLKQNIHELKSFIDMASHLGFNGVHLMKGYDPGKGSLPKDSYLDSFDGLVDWEFLESYAANHNVMFTNNLGYLKQLNAGECLCPWEDLRLSIRPEGWLCRLCCMGNTNIFLRCDKKAPLHDIDKFWKHERVEFIRQTVNDSEKILANKMCLSCRIRTKDLTHFYRNEEIFNSRFRLDKTFDKIVL